MNVHLLFYYIGIFIVFASHVYILAMPNKPLTSMKTHCILNIVAASFIAYYFMNKEGYIKF